MFNVGDRVVHPNHGAGTIQDILRDKETGTTGDCYLFTMPVGNMTVTIPVDAAERIGMRSVVDAEEADRLLSLLKITSVDDEANWNKRFRDNIERVKSGDPEAVIFVMKTLTDRDKIKNLSTGERKMLNSAAQIFISEIALAKGLDYAEAEKLVEDGMRADTPPAPHA